MQDLFFFSLIVVQLERGVHKVSEKLYFMKKFLYIRELLSENWGWSGGAMVLGKLPVPGRPTILITVGQGPIALTVGAGGGGWTFLLSSILSLLSPSLREAARYRLKYCLKGPLNPKQPTNQSRKTTKFLVEIWCPTRCINRTTGISV